SSHLLPGKSLPKTLLFQLLGLSVATLSTVTHYGLHFTIISDISLDSNSYRAIHHAGTSWAHLSRGTWQVVHKLLLLHGGRFIAALLGLPHLGELLGGCERFAVVSVTYRSLLSSQVEDSMMDVYDLVYEEVRRNASSFRRHELTAIHEAVSCLSALAETPALGYIPDGFDCLQEIQDFLKKHMDFVSTLLAITIAFTVYGMILTSFLWFSIHFSSNLDRKGKYILRESFWRREMFGDTHNIPWEGIARGQAGDMSRVSPSCTISALASPSEQRMLWGGAGPHLCWKRARTETCTHAQRCRSPHRRTYGL
uniref:Tetraspanin 32 n=1 Tax=Falco tinnunculus TaxID=100819 RepID=A0A8C4V0Q7_FALTI